MKQKQCSCCKNKYPVEQIEQIIDNGTRKNYCQFCLEGIYPSKMDKLSWKFAINYNRLTGVPLDRLINL